MRAGGVRMRKRGEWASIIARVREIIAEYDFPLTLRQVFYRLVAAQALDNTRSEYNQLSDHLARAREQSEIPWDSIADLTREPIAPSTWADLGEFAETVRQSFRLDVWERQPAYVEIWLEKQALSELFRRVCNPYAVRLMVGRGYSSASFLFDGAGHLEGVAAAKPVRVCYFGDFDPSGLDIFRDLRERLARYGADVVCERLALTPAQIEEHELPPAMAKRSDTRTPAFLARHGDVAVELDALPPDLLRRMVEAAILETLDLSEFEATRAEERRLQAELEEWADGLAGRGR